MDQNNTAQETQPTEQTPNLTSNVAPSESLDTDGSSKKFNTQTIIYVFLGVLVVILAGLTVYLYIMYGSAKTELEGAQEELKTTMEKIETVETENTELKQELTMLKTPVESTNYYSVQFVQDEYQKVGQLFEVTEATTAAGVEIQAANASGEAVTVYVSEADAPENALATTALTSGRFTADDVVDEQVFIVEFTDVLELTAETQYFMWFETADETTTMDVAYTTGNQDASGSMYNFSAPGGFSQDGFTWQASEDNDLQFTFVETVF